MNTNMMDKNTKEQDMVELNQKDLEEVSGGTFTLNYYWKSEYEEAGIKVVTHFIDKDEFWWKGENIGEKAANSVVYFTAVKGRAPSSLAESLLFWEANHKKKFERHRH